MKKVAAILFLLLSAVSTLIAEAFYPYSIAINKPLDGGKIFYNDSLDKYYFINYGLLGEDASISEFDANSCEISKGIFLQNSKIISGYTDKSSLYLFATESDSLFINIYRNDILINKIFISEIPEANYQNVNFDSRGNLLVFQIGSLLYLFEFDGDGVKKIQLLSQECIAFSFVKVEDKFLITFVVDNHNRCLLCYVDEQGNSIHKQVIPFSDYISINQARGNLLLQFGSTANDKTLLYVVNPKNYLVVLNYWIDTFPYLINISENGNLSYLKFLDGSYKVIFSQADKPDKNVSVDVPKEFVQPLYMSSIKGLLLVVFQNGIVTIDQSMQIRSADFIPIGQRFSSIENSFIVNEKLILTSKVNSLCLNFNKNDYWQINAVMHKYGAVIAAFIVLLLIIILTNKLRHHKKLLKIISDVPSAGFLFIIDSKGKLVNINERAGKLLSVSSYIPMNRNFKEYFKDEDIIPIYNFYEANKPSKETISQKISLTLDKNISEWLCYIIPIQKLANGTKGVVLTGIDITEQLERKRLTNWAQLAHDMQTNLSTIRLNAEHLDVETAGENKTRQKKILYQVNVLMQRIRDVITVGRTDNLDLSVTDAASICNLAISEFDDYAFPDVSFVSELTNFNLNCDKSKLIRAIRNAVENGIRALPDKSGSITLKCYKDNKYAYFCVKDSGKGMDEDTRNRFLKPYFTTASESGGSGIGTMIMQRVAELHKGKLEISSQEGQGTEIIFVIPLNLKQEPLKA